jgi:hypothetical protein
LLLCGRSSRNALGLTNVDVHTKNISNKNIKSVMDDMLKLGEILLEERIAISFN